MSLENTAPEEIIHLDGFHELALATRRRVDQTLQQNNGVAFLVKVERNELFEAYLANLPEDRRQEFNCSCCKKFLREYGHAAIVDQSNCQLRSLLWDENDDAIPEDFKASVAAMRAIVEASTIDKAFVSDKTVVGDRIKGGHEHFELDLGALREGSVKLKTARQNMIFSRETQSMFAEAVGIYPAELAKTAFDLFTLDQNLHGYPTFLAYLQMFQSVHNKLTELKDGTQQQRRNLIWLCSVMLPFGTTRIKNTPLGGFLDTLKEGGPANVQYAIAGFKAKVKPTEYKRPKTAPAEATVKRAEEIIAQLGLESALLRRYARADELRYLWQPTVSDEPKKGEGVFSSVMARDAAPKDTAKLEIDGGSITMAEFVRDVLPSAESVEMLLMAGLSAPFGSFVTAADPNAGRLLRWDREEDRNPINYYVHSKPSPMEHWRIPNQTHWAKISGVAKAPEEWTSDTPKHGKQVCFVIEGAHATIQAGLALFPDDLRSELHEVRGVIESFSNSNQLSGLDESVCGMFFHLEAPMQVGLKFAVYQGNYKKTYLVDRTK